MQARAGRVLSRGAGLGTLTLLAVVGFAELMDLLASGHSAQVPPVGLAVFLGIVAPVTLLLWTAGRREKPRTLAVVSAVWLAASAPSVIGAATLLTNPAQLPAATQGLMPIGVASVVVVSGLLLRPWLSMGVASWGALQYLVLFALARPSLEAAVLDADLAMSLGGWGEAVRRVACLLFVGAATAFVGQEFRKAVERTVSEALRRQAAERDHQRAELQSALQQAASEAKSAFVASLCHELRTPTHGILAVSEDVLRRNALSPRIRASVQTILGSGHHLLDLIEESLDTAAVEAGRVRVLCVDTASEPLVKEVVDLLQARLPKDGPTLGWTVGAEVPATVHTDPKRVRQVLFNLLGNALKHTDEGVVHVHLSAPRPDCIQLEVTDTGTGIPETLLEAGVVFEPFTQHLQNGPGQGLGLHITHRVVTAMGGTVTLSNRLNGGTLARVLLPQDDPHSAIPPTIQAFPNPDAIAALRQVAERGDMRAAAQQVAALDGGHLDSFRSEAEDAIRQFDDERLLALLAQAPPGGAA